MDLYNDGLLVDLKWSVIMSEETLYQASISFSKRLLLKKLFARG